MARESESSRHNSKSAQHPSPNTSRREGKPATEKSPSRIRVNVDLGSKDVDQKEHSRLQDSLPPESQPERNSLRKADRHGERVRNSGIAAAPRSRSYSQRDDRGSAAQDGRSSRFRTADRGSWRDSKDELKRDSKDEHRTTAKLLSKDLQGRHEKSTAQGEDYHVHCHDKLSDAHAGLPPQSKKRRQFREEKLLEEPESIEKAVADLTVPTKTEQPAEGHERRDVKRGHDSRYADRNERDREYRGQRSLQNRGRPEHERSSFASGNRYTGGGGFSGGADGRFRRQDSYSGRHGNHSGGSNVDKWKHDLFHEANRSPTPKNEEDPIAKVEALLSS